MKSNIKKLLILFAFSFSILSCSKDDNKSQTLPEATQTGRGIFACYVDGKPFIDNSGSPNGISFNGFYQLVDGEYYFGIHGEGRIKDLITVGIYSNRSQIDQPNLFQIISNNPNNFYGLCSFNPNINSQETSLTDSNYTGELNVTKFDLQNQIVSGTFWFNIKNPYTNETVKITDGRFDAHFGQ